MKILWENLIDSATLSSLNASLNYPVINLQSNFLYERYQSSIDVDTIGILFEEESNISDFWYGFTNATKLILRLYNYDGDLLHTETINNPELDIDAIKFTEVPDVDHAELDIEGPLGVYLGGIGLGLGYIMPDPLSEWEEAEIDNSDFDESPAGQTLQNYIKPLRAYLFSFEDVTHEIKEEIMAMYNGVGKGSCLWFDFFELDHSFMKPMYGKIMAEIRPGKTGRRFSFELATKEAR